MAFRATLSVEYRSQALFSGLHFGEPRKTVTKILFLLSAQTRQRIGQVLRICRAERLRVDPPLREHQKEHSCCCQQHDHPFAHAPRHRLSLLARIGVLGLRVNEVSGSSRKGCCRSEQAAAEQTESRRAPTRTHECGMRNHRAYPPDRAMSKENAGCWQHGSGRVSQDLAVKHQWKVA